MLKELLTWWLQRMAELVPAPLVRRSGGPSSALVVDLEEEPGARAALGFVLRRHRQKLQLGRFPLDEEGLRSGRAALAAYRSPGAVILRLPAETLLEREVMLPLAAERQPEGVLRFDMDRLTPFPAEDLFWTWVVERRDRARRMLHLRLSFVPKARIQPVLAALSAIGIDATEIQSMAAVAGVPARRIALVPPSTPWHYWKRRVLFSGACLCAALFAAVVTTPFVKQSLERAAVERRISAIAPQVQLAEALRKRVGEAETGREVRAAEQARLGDPLHALAALTELLPDDTYLTDLS
jgi:general secretion pathway protein L